MTSFSKRCPRCHRKLNISRANGRLFTWCSNKRCPASSRHEAKR